MRTDYLTLGNPTLDLQPDGTFRLGGSAVYCALQAARLGLRSAIVGRANPAELEPYWRPYSGEASLLLQPADMVTTFRNVSAGDLREQWISRWAGQIQEGPFPESSILHLAPVAREIVLDLIPHREKWPLVCLTPQGLVRSWDGPAGRVELRQQDIPAAIAEFIDIVVVSEAEAPYVASLLADVPRQGGLAVITRGTRGCEVLTRRGSESFGPCQASAVVDTTGAGDCFTAALVTASFWGLSLTDSVALASAAAAACVEGAGPAAVGTLAQLAGRAGAPSLGCQESGRR